MEQKVIVITGASAGIGAAIARQLGQAGNQVAISARRESLLNGVAASIGPNALAVAGDMTRRSDVDRVKNESLKAFGRIDVWINNVGRGITRPVLQLSDDDIDQMISVNLRSAIYGMQVVAPYFQQMGKGHIINISSFLGRVPLVTYRSIYSASKAALNLLTANLRTDLRDQYPDIHVSLVMPGIVATDFHQNALYGTPQPRAGSGAGVPGAQTADEVAAVVVDLINNPRAEAYTNPASAEIARRYREDPEAFERNFPRRS